MVEGRLKLDQWDDKTTGQKRSRLGVTLEGFQFLGGGDRSEGGPSEAAPRSRPTPSAPKTESPEVDGPPPEDDDVPF
jgi:single-strand DNA-binding protein